MNPQCINPHLIGLGVAPQLRGLVWAGLTAALVIIQKPGYSISGVLAFGGVAGHRR